jgi:hypothetical protein
MGRCKCDMSLYVKGRNAEYACINYLKNMGAFPIVRSAGSKGLIDLVAFFPASRTIQLIQVKKESSVRSNEYLKKKYAQLKDLEGYYQVVGRIFIKETRGFKILFL